ncbi:MAG: hypothetical protein ABI947_17025 [Chloroflexota bacterium]
MRSYLKYFFAFVICIIFYATQKPPQSLAQSNKLQCGSIIEGELSGSPNYYANGVANGSSYWGKEYTIDMAPGDILNLSLKGIGSQLDVKLYLTDPQNKDIGANGGSTAVEMDSEVLASRGTYKITVLESSPSLYTLSIGCTLRDGTIIKPGDVAQPTVQPSNGNSNSSVFSVTGFPGLPPVDFSNAVTVSLQNDSNNGKMPANGNTILGYTLDAQSGDKLDLSFTRISGNLNLGLVVLSNDNKVIYQASLVNAETMSVRFTLPVSGQYTIGVFRIDLLPPTSPKATAFTIQGKLNP